MQNQIERELKYDVPDGWVLPDPKSVAPDGATVQVEEVDLHSAYYDTPDRDLLRHGITLRRRTGDADAGWHLKVPAGDARTELRLPVDGETVPDEFRGLVRALTNGHELRVIASLDTHRTINRLVSSTGTALAEIADDSVKAVANGDAAVIQKWREVEVELGEADERLLRRSARWLADSGAWPSDSGSKLARAVGAGVTPEQPPDGSVAAVVLAHLREQHRAIVRGDIELRRHSDVVHQTRVATRRFRSVLRVFADLFEPVWARHLDGELKWYAAKLGAVRDLQVMRTHLRDASATLPDNVRDQTANCIGERLDADERSARGELLEVLDSNRYAALLVDVRAFTEHLPGGGDRRADKVHRYVRAANRKAAKRLAAAARPPQRDERAHRARKAAKRSRYIAELATPVLGKSAKRLAKREKRVQNKLGMLQDSVMAGDYLRRIGTEATGPAGFGLGVLWCGEQKYLAKARTKVKDLA